VGCILSPIRGFRGRERRHAISAAGSRRLAGSASAGHEGYILAEQSVEVVPAAAAGRSEGNGAWNFLLEAPVGGDKILVE
jgi:hypothetical protein